MGFEFGFECCDGICLMCGGRELRILGVEQLKARAPMVNDVCRPVDTATLSDLYFSMHELAFLLVKINWFCVSLYLNLFIPA